ncbi:DNA (cytosine-5)-methyltransferase 1 [Raoultella sp. BIGb0138]|nr:phage N-6-adenine-methyltransferase [Raoultella sp. BIGb0138]TCW07071.1 DNA (cytosine-5)-methyltransferase 1 [Raoultella sp. BIGb0138]
MIYGSICSGIEAATVAWEPLGWKAAWFSEIEAFPSAVLAERWPEVVNLGDMTKIAAAVRTGEVQAPDVMVGGTPCQAFSIAGLRNGLADARGQLTLSYVELANAIDDKRIERGEEEAIFVWENVPGVLTSHDNAFGFFLAGLAGESSELHPSGGKWTHSGCVYGPQRAIAWIVKDAQYFGVAQRRKRVFVVASARKGFDPGQVLFESEGVRRDTPPSREPQTAVAGLTARGVGTCGADDNQAQAGHIIAECANGNISHTLKAEGFDGSEDGSGRGIPVIAFGGGNTGGNIDVAACLTAKGQRIDFEVETFAVHGTQDPDTNHELAHALGRNHGQENAISSGMMVRRLTPVECERLQGFPDNHTLISWRGKEAAECPDGPRYRAIGNSMAVPVMRWIGERITATLPAKKSASDYGGSKTPVEQRNLWQTPIPLFVALDAEFCLTLDAAASADNSLCNRYITEEQNTLRTSWADFLVAPGYAWLNPPYSDITPFVQKAAAESKNQIGTVMLVPADTSVGWFREAIETASEVRFIVGGRLAFINPVSGKPVSGNNKGSMLIIWHPYPRTHCQFTTVERDALMSFGARLIAKREAA